MPFLLVRCLFSHITSIIDHHPPPSSPPPPPPCLQVQDRFAVQVPELPETIDTASYM